MDAESNALIDAVYASALDPALWPDALSKITTKFGAVAATISAPGSFSEELFPTGHEEPRTEYVENWHGLNIIKAAVDDTPDGIYCDWRMFPRKTIDKDRYYQEFRRKYGIRHVVGLATTYDVGRRLRFGLQMPLAAPIPEDGLLKAFDTIARHVCRAFEISARMIPTRSYRSEFGDELFRSQYAAAVVDPAARIIEANDLFVSLSQDGIGIVGGALRCAVPRDQPALDALVRGAIDATAESRERLALVSRPSGKRPLVVRAVSLSKQHRESARADGLLSCRAMIFVLDLEQANTAGTHETLRVLGLTATECRIAFFIGQGLPPRDIAVKLGLTEGTVRTRVKGIFSKLDLSRQSEMAHIVTQIQMFGGTSQ